MRELHAKHTDMRELHAKRVQFSYTSGHCLVHGALPRSVAAGRAEPAVTDCSWPTRQADLTVKSRLDRLGKPTWPWNAPGPVPPPGPPTCRSCALCRAGRGWVAAGAAFKFKNILQPGLAQTFRSGPPYGPCHSKKRAWSARPVPVTDTLLVGLGSSYRKVRTEARTRVRRLSPTQPGGPKSITRKHIRIESLASCVTLGPGPGGPPDRAAGAASVKWNLGAHTNSVMSHHIMNWYQNS